MGLVVDYTELDAVGRGINNAASGWMSALEAVASAAQAVGGSMVGQAAENVRSYQSAIHASLISSLGMIISAHVQNYVVYKQDYQSQIDSDTHARIRQEELPEIKIEIDKTLASLQERDAAVRAAIANISDIVYLSFSGLGAVETAEEKAGEHLQALSEDIVALESRHISADFEETGSLIQALEQAIQQQLSNPRSYKADFNIQGLANDASFMTLLQAYDALDEAQRGKSEVIQRAFEQEEAWQAALMEERAREASQINWLVTGLCVVGSIAIIVGTGGTATPLVVAAVSAGSGAITSGVNNYTGQYVENGDWGSADLLQVGKWALIGGGTGFLTGYTGSVGSQAITSSLSKIQPVAQLLKSSSTVTRVTTHFAIGASVEAVTGIGSRFIGTAISTGGDLEAAWDAASNVKSIVFDAMIGGVSEGIKGLNDPEVPPRLNQKNNSGGHGDKVPAPSGEWKKANEHMSDFSRQYQAQIVGGHEGEVYVQNGVKFDGMIDGVLIETKGHYKQFVGKDGNFRSWFSGAKGFTEQARRQLDAADGVPIRWFFAEESVMEATRTLFKEKGISGIELFFEPMK